MQKRSLIFVLRAWGYRMESWLLRHGESDGEAVWRSRRAARFYLGAAAPAHPPDGRRFRLSTRRQMAAA